MRHLVHRVEVYRDAESHANLVGPGIAPANGAGGIVHFVGDAVPGERLSWKKHRFPGLAGLDDQKNPDPQGDK